MPTIQIKCPACKGRGFYFEQLVVRLVFSDVKRDIAVRCRKCAGSGTIEGEASGD